MYVKWNYGLLSHKKIVLLRKYQLMQPTYISSIGLYHAMYSRYIFMKCKWWLNDVRSAPSCQQYRPQSKQCTKTHIYTNTHRNKNYKWSIKLNIYFLYWYFQHNQCLKIKNYAVYNIHRLAWGSFACVTTGQLSIVPIHKIALRTVTLILIIFIIIKSRN